MDEKIVIEGVAAVVIFVLLVLIDCYRTRRAERKNAEKNDAQGKADAERRRLQVLELACNELWLFLYKKKHPNSGKFDAVELQNVFDGAILLFDKEKAAEIYAVIKEKVTAENNELNNQAYGLIIKRLSDYLLS